MSLFATPAVRSFVRATTCCVAMLSLGACSLSAPLPDAKKLDEFDAQAEKLAQHDIAMLDAQLASGEITKGQYDTAKADILANVHDRAITAAWTSHNLDQKYRQSLGLPTPDRLGDIPVPVGNTLPTGSTRRAFNSGDQNLGGMGNPQAVKQFFSGYTPGGRTQRSF